MIHEFDDGTCVISSHRTWLPGCYENQKAALRAFRLSVEQLQALQDLANQRAGGAGGVITGADIDLLKGEAP